MSTKSEATAQAVGTVRVIGTGEIDPRELVIDEASNGRRYPVKVDEMAGKLLADGQLQPIWVKRGEDGKLHVKFGFRRARGGVYILEHGLATEWKVRYEEVDADDTTLFLMNLKENKDREGTSVIDDAHNYLRLKGEPHNLNQREIARQAGVSDAMVSRVLTLVAGTADGKPPLNAKTQKLVHVGKIPSETAYELVQMDEEKRAKYVDKIVGGEKVTVSDARQANTRKRKKKGAKTDEAGGRALTAKAIRLPFEEVVTKYKPKEEGEDMPVFVQLCDVLTRMCTGQLVPKTALRKVRELCEA